MEPRNTATSALIGVIVLATLLGPLFWLFAGSGSSAFSLGASLVLGATIGFAVRKPAANLMGGWLLRIERFVAVGDHIEADGASGTVTKVGWFRTRLESDDGRDVWVANRRLTSRRVVRMPQGRSLLRLKISAAPGIDPERLRDVSIRVVHAHDDVRSTPPPEILFHELGASAFQFELTVWTDVPPPAVRLLANELCDRLDKALADEDIRASVRGAPLLACDKSFF